MMREDLGITTLIDLHDQIIDQGDGYWIKIEAWVVPSSKDIPHGVRYFVEVDRVLKEARKS